MSENRLTVSAKCSDMVTVRLGDKTLEGSVPDCLGGGDYISLTIDAATGQILDWPGLAAVEKEIAGEDEEDEFE